MHALTARTLVAVLAALALVVAACETDDEDDPLIEDTPAEEGDPEATPGAADEPDAAEAPDLRSDEGATVVELLAGYEEFSELVAAIEAAGLEAELSADGPYTVFAPTDEGFAIVPEHERAQLSDDPDLLAQRVLGHIVAGELRAEELTDGHTVTMMDGTERQILATADGEVFVGSALLLAADAEATNGVVHALDFVLPSAPAAADEDAG
jgi:uncharacterized surface protein with fasciclin (FAS1) repeats